MRRASVGTNGLGAGSSPPRILIVESNDDGTVGGSHQALFDLIAGFDHDRFHPVVMFYEDNAFARRLRDRGTEVVLFDELTSRKRALNPVRGFLSRVTRFGMDIVQCRRELQRLRIDLLHMNNSPAIGNDTWLPAARSLGIPCMVTAMGTPFRAKRFIHRWLSRRFDLYLAISRHVADGLRAQGVADERIRLNYAGVDFDSLRKRAVRSTDVVRSALGVGEGQVLALMVGNIRAWKGQREVISALSLVPEDIRARMRFYFVGAAGNADTEYQAELRDAISEANLNNCVAFLGARSDVPDLYRAADIVVHASTTPEPFGLVVPEAMALGCAVIATSFGGPAEVITPDTGILCDPARPEEYARAIELLVRDAVLRKSIAASAPARAEQFGIERNVSGTLAAYRQVLSAHSS